MAFRIDDFKCNDCEIVFEVLLDTREQELEQSCCLECNGNNVEKVLSVGTGSKVHGSWSRWRA